MVTVAHAVPRAVGATHGRGVRRIEEVTMGTKDDGMTKPAADGPFAAHLQAMGGHLDDHVRRSQEKLDRMVRRLSASGGDDAGAGGTRAGGAAGGGPAGLEARIRERLHDGFGHWNAGYADWLDWCGTLYEPDAHYTVQGRRLTLQEYKDLMGVFFDAYDVELGGFHDMLVVGDLCAIHYAVRVTEKATGRVVDQETMEFVHFMDNPAPVGVRVVEGWALSDQPLSDRPPTAA